MMKRRNADFLNIYKKKSKKRIIKFFSIIAILFILFVPLIQPIGYISATDQEESDVGGQIEDQVDDQLGNLDFGSLEDIIASLTGSESAIFGKGSFFDKVKLIISGEFADGNSSLWEAIISLFFDDLLALLPIIATVIAISIFGSMLQGLKPSSNSKSIQDVIHFVTYGIIVVLLLGVVVKMVNMTGGVISNIKGQMDAIFPILLTLLTALGGTVSVSVYQPAMALLTGSIINIFTYILLPIFIFSAVFSVVSNLSNTVKLDKFTSFFNSSYKWLTGLIFTVFSAFLSIQGFTAGSVDGISIRTAKYAIKSYIPILGGYLSDGMSIILASSTLIKNAVGACGLVLLLATIISPLLKLIIFMLALKLMAGIIEPLGNSRVANFISGLSKSLVLLIVLIIGVAFIYFIMIGLIMCSANIL